MFPFTLAQAIEAHGRPPIVHLGIPNPLELVPRPHVLYNKEHRNRPMHAFQERYARVNLQELQEKVFWGRWRVCVAVSGRVLFLVKETLQLRPAQAIGIPL